LQIVAEIAVRTGQGKFVKALLLPLKEILKYAPIHKTVNFKIRLVIRIFTTADAGMIFERCSMSTDATVLY
jgi:hypothetical protein